MPRSPQPGWLSRRRAEGRRPVLTRPTQACPRCGAPIKAQPHPALVALQWLKDGVRRGHSFSCSACGLRLSGSFLSYAGRVHPSWQAPLVLPVALARVIRHRRSVRLPPYAYLAGALAGTGAGVALERRLRWWSWVPGVAVPVSMAAATVSSAFTQGRSARTLDAMREAVTATLHPGREMQAFYRQEESMFRSSGLPLYGLGSSFLGARTLRGWEGTDDEVTGLGLGHGDPFDAGAPGVEVRVKVRSAFLHAGIGDRGTLARELWHRAHPLPEMSPENFLAAHWEREHELASRPKPVWGTVAITVDGQPVEFQWLAEGEHWVAVRDLDDVFITIWAHGMPPGMVDLVRVHNLEPYVTGSRARRAQREAAREKRRTEKRSMKTVTAGGGAEAGE